MVTGNLKELSNRLKVLKISIKALKLAKAFSSDGAIEKEIEKVKVNIKEIENEIREKHLRVL